MTETIYNKIKITNNKIEIELDNIQTILCYAIMNDI